MTRRPDDPLDDIATGYQASQILLAANRLGLFAALAKGPMTGQALAQGLDSSPRGTRILCDALVSLGLLERDGGSYRNSELAFRHLLPDSPQPRTDLLQHAAKLYERWGRLYDAVRSGRPVADEELDPRLIGGGHDFARAMADVGRRSAAASADALDLSEARRLLDVGGGPGIYAIEFARRWPELEVVVLDREEALEVARESVAGAALIDRIRLQRGDVFTDELGGPYDAIFVSNVVHSYSAVENRRLVERCAQSLAPGGRLILKDFFLDEDRMTPSGGALFAVNMLVSTEGGDCYTVREARAWFEAAGLDLQEMRDVAAKSRLLMASRPM